YAETPPGAAATRCPAPANDRQPARTEPDPSASPRFREGRLFAAHSQPLRPELIELQLAPQRQRKPARAPLPWPAQTQFRQSDADDRGVRRQPLDTVFRKQRQCPQPRGAIFQNLDRPPPRQFLSIVDLTQIQHVPLHHAPAGDACVLDNAPVVMLLAILPADR